MNKHVPIFWPYEVRAQGRQRFLHCWPIEPFPSAWESTGERQEGRRAFLETLILMVEGACV
jgi:hypothetical protein